MLSRCGRAGILHTLSATLRREQFSLPWCSQLSSAFQRKVARVVASPSALLACRPLCCYSSSVRSARALGHENAQQVARANAATCQSIRKVSGVRRCSGRGSSLTFGRRMTLAFLIHDYFGPPASVLVGLPLGLLSAATALVSAFLRMRGSERKKKVATRFMWAGNVGSIVALGCWAFLSDTYFW